MDMANKTLRVLDRATTLSRLADELFHQCIAFLYYPKEIFLIRQNKTLVLQTIERSWSRKTEWGDDDPHWGFGVEDLQMQMVHCPLCGEYIHHNDEYRFSLSPKLYCRCNQ